MTSSGICFSCAIIAGEVYPLYEFGKSDDISQFIVTNDSDHNEGYSHSTFEKSPAGYGLFSGQLSSNVPKQGQLTKAGYCNITSKRVMVSSAQSPVLRSSIVRLTNCILLSFGVPHRNHSSANPTMTGESIIR